MGLHPFLTALGVGPSAVQRTNTAASATNITTAATAYNNITPVELVTSTARPVAAIQLRTGSAWSQTGARRDAIIEVMAGSSGNEYPIIEGILIGGRASQSRLTLPLYIPEGTRLSVRARAAATSATHSLGLDLYYLSDEADAAGLPMKWVAYGTVDDASANARGTIVVPGNSNTWGSWTAITTSTTYAHELWMPQVDAGTMNSGSLSANTYRTQWAFETTANAPTAVTNGTVYEGPGMIVSTSEAVGSNYLGQASIASVLGLGGDNFGLIACPRPAGSAISMRGMCSGTHSSNGLGGAILAAI